MVTENAKKYYSICEINLVSLSILFTVIHMTLLFITPGQRSHSVCHSVQGGCPYVTPACDPIGQLQVT